jgi:pyrimidine/purine-5'-nucleotide nucleosidase
MNVLTTHSPVALTDLVSTRVTPRGSLESLSQHEVAKLLDRSQSGLYPLFRKCALAVLNMGSPEDDPRKLLDQYHNFDIRILQQPWGLKLELENAPGSAFVDGRMITGVQEHLFAVLRDIIYLSNEILEGGRFDLQDPDHITNAIFAILRNARVLDRRAHSHPDLVVCWGGHSISADEYDYTKKVGYELGLRGLNICTGCGPGAMKGPMKGATIGHSKQRVRDGRYIGLTEPGIIAAEPPNPIVNNLVILPDMEKRLEAFVRLGHGIIIFPGGVGTAEEILYLLSILLDPENEEQPLPLIFTGPESSRSYFEELELFLKKVLGPEATGRYRLILNSPAEAAREMAAKLEHVKNYRRKSQDAFFFNWNLKIVPELQRPFELTELPMKPLVISRELPLSQQLIQLRRIFSAIVAANIKEAGLKYVETHGAIPIEGDADLMNTLDRLLQGFVKQRRMKLSGDYRPVYRLIPRS